MDIIISKKVELIGWLAGDDLILQYVHSQELITMAEYTRIKSIQDPIKKTTELLDMILSKGQSCCIAFLELLKKNEVNESRPELREWIANVNISAEQKENSNTTQAGSASIIADNEAFLLKNRGKLIDRIKTVDRIVDDLVMTGEMAANVHAEKTEQAKMRKVLDYTNSKKAAKLLVDALFKHAGDVMEDLITA
ncbi:hypothetical protein HF521_016590 [Silurus meridionalis]|uniref:CARD domain-containing protein n=1 Tax=Silurus meridionalis TaxID=175797 RepID=A0A8T0BWJ5_SILME|nr:hypothetical protein HF521_016590 [Silurus meridionalis]